LFVMPSRRALLRFATLGALTAAAPGTARAQPRPAPLRLGFISIIPMSQLFVMESQRWTKGAGLDLILKRFSSGPPMVDALLSGALDVAYIGIQPAMIARARGADVKVVAANVVEPVALVGRGGLAGTFGAAGSAREAFKQFRDAGRRPARIATLPRGSTPDTVLRYYLQEAQVAPADVELIGVGEDEVQRLLLAGAVDAAAIVEPILTVTLERDRSARILATARQMMPGHPGAVVLVTGDVIAQNRAAVARLVRLHARATDYVREDPARAVPDVVEYLGQGLVDPGMIRKALVSDATNLIADPRAIIEPTRLLQAVERRLGLQTPPLDIDGLFDFSFYDALARR
jgi:NitT/TauT family transport system substrate-binding protein